MAEVRVPGGRGVAAMLLSLALHAVLLGGLAAAQRSQDLKTVTVELVTPPPADTPAREPEVMEPKSARRPSPPPEPRRERPTAFEPPAPILPPEPAPPREPAIVAAPPMLEPVAPRPVDTEPPRPAAPAGPRSESAPGPISALPSDPSTGPGTSTAPPAAPAAPSQAAISHEPSGRDGFSGPRVDRQRPPRYPDVARHEGAEGVVLVKALVRADGAIGAVEVERSSGYAALDRAAVQAVREWRFRPAERNGARVAAWVVVPIHFQISR